jgi:hypothetical protein
MNSVKTIAVFLIGIVVGGVQLGPLGTAATNGPIVPAPGDYDYGEIGGMQGKPKYSEKTCPSAALSTTNPTCCPDANPGRRDGKPATNRLRYGTACCWLLMLNNNEVCRTSDTGFDKPDMFSLGPSERTVIFPKITILTQLYSG